MVSPDEKEAGVSLTVAMDYDSNSTNKSNTNVIIKSVTENILNTLIDRTTNMSNSSHVLVLLGDVDTGHFDVVMTSNVSTDNVSAVLLQVLFENELETEL